MFTVWHHALQAQYDVVTAEREALGGYSHPIALAETTASRVRHR